MMLGHSDMTQMLRAIKSWERQKIFGFGPFAGQFYSPEVPTDISSITCSSGQNELRFGMYIDQGNKNPLRP